MLKVLSTSYITFWRYTFRFLNPGPSQYLQDNENKLGLFHKHALHFLYINLNSSLQLKIDELRDILGHTKPY